MDSQMDDVLAMMYEQSDKAGWLTEAQYQVIVDYYSLDSLEQEYLLNHSHEGYVISSNKGGYYIQEKGG